jgi:MFS superfamily sulfate permease-like transporter
LPDLIAESAGLALILFTSGMLTARSFAEKNRYEIDADQELAALGAANIASALSQGFAVTGADSRTAMADSSGGRTQVTGLVAASTIAVILVFFTKPLGFIPVPALAGVLIFASLSLFSTQPLYRIWRVDRTAVGLSILTTLGVVAFGAVQAILIAVGLSLAQFVKLVARPKDEVLGIVEGMNGLHSIERHPRAQSIPDVLIYRFSSPLTFFNADYFKRRARFAVKTADPAPRVFLLDAIPFGLIDVTGLYALRDLRNELNGQDIRFFIAGRRTELLNWFRSAGLYRPEYEDIFFATLDEAVMACR